MTQNVNLTGNTLLVDGVNIGNANIFSGAGAPSFTAPQGSLYLNTTGSSVSTRAYINTTGSTTWTAITTVG